MMILNMRNNTAPGSSTKSTESVQRGTGSPEDRQHFSVSRVLSPQATGHPPALRPGSTALPPFREDDCECEDWAHICPFPVSESRYSPPSSYRDQWKLKR
ncbi:unnamed protein product [Rangifer tarandus platyrhynchus]|uniref:Uncharacterized protein n=1 Tax=Rangifer tarandus platyrhynchus TaxID=3082113 RepID=A0AC59YLM0_RANTA